MFAGVSSSSQATCPNTEMRRRDRRYDSEVRPVRCIVLHHFGLSRTIGFQAAVSDTSGAKHPQFSHQLIVRSKCLRRNTDKCLIYTEVGVACQALVAPYPF